MAEQEMPTFEPLPEEKAAENKKEAEERLAPTPEIKKDEAEQPMSVPEVEPRLEIPPDLPEKEPAPLLPSETPVKLLSPEIPPAKIEEPPKTITEVKKPEKAKPQKISAFFSKVLEKLKAKIKARRIKSGRWESVEKELFEPTFKKALAEQILLAQKETEKYKAAPKGTQKDRQKNRMIIAWREAINLYEHEETELEKKRKNLLHNLGDLYDISSALKKKIARETSKATTNKRYVTFRGHKLVKETGGAIINRLYIALRKNEVLVKNSEENLKSFEKRLEIIGNYRNQFEKNLQKL